MSEEPLGRAVERPNRKLNQLQPLFARPSLSAGEKGAADASSAVGMGHRQFIDRSTRDYGQVVRSVLASHKDIADNIASRSCNVERGAPVLSRFSVEPAIISELDHWPGDVNASSGSHLMDVPRDGCDLVSIVGPGSPNYNAYPPSGSTSAFPPLGGSLCNFSICSTSGKHLVVQPPMSIVGI